jgi:asparagine synthase (glutamine-hydrolysing)
MCGIYGMVSTHGALIADPDQVLRMGPALRHRGPDGSGMLRRPHVVMGAERLRVVDLDPRADQPFADSDDRVWLACNGEVYNASELRRRFAHYPFRSHADVEVIIPLYRERGPEGIADLVGMFALALWDEAGRTLILARDRAGEKPLFYSATQRGIAFASEIQALLALPDVARRLDPEALAAYCALGYVPEPRTMFRSVRAVPAGTVLMMGPEGCREHRYWRPEVIAPVDRPADAELRLRELLRAAVRRQMAADVPVGVFTSGGVDSSLIAALAAEPPGPEQIRTYTARFTAPTYDESRFGRALARHLGTRHTEMVVDETALGQAFDALTTNLAEPIADPAVLPTLLLARCAREHVTVVLGGEGADELFGGYPTYLGHALAPRFARLPHSLRRALSAAIGALPESANKVPVSGLLKGFVAGADLPWQERHLRWFGTGLDPTALGLSASSVLPALPALPKAQSVLAQAMLLDYQTYLRDQLLVKVDRATMQVGLEARAPYLDPDLTRFTLSLDPSLKVRGFTTKVLLKRAARAWLPARLVRRRKRGLSVPVASWLRGAFRAEAERLLAPGRLRREGLVSDVYVSGLLRDHLSGRHNHARPLWTLIVLQRWLERWAPEVTG